MREFIILLVCLLILNLFITIDRECLTSKPSDKQRKMMVEQILSNKELFSGNYNLDTAKNNIDWLDPISYEDLRNLYRKNMFHNDKIKQILI